MMLNDEFKNNFEKSPKPVCKISFLPQNSIPTYTVLCVLGKMKHELGLEAMLEYTEKYLEIIDNHNPRLKAAVAKALSMMSVEKIYADAMGRTDRNN